MVSNRQTQLGQRQQWVHIACCFGEEGSETVSQYYLNDVQDEDNNILVCSSEDGETILTIHSFLSATGVWEGVMVEDMGGGAIVLPLDAMESVIGALEIVLRRCQASSDTGQ